MINFLSEKNKNNVKKEYSFRVATLFLIVFSLVLIFISVFLSSAHILSVYREGVISNQLAMVKESSFGKSNVSLDDVKKINEIVKTISSATVYQKPASDFIKSILNSKNSAIAISSMSSDFDTNNNIRISIKGFSKTRDGLTKFVKDIKSLNLFSGVDLPISSLVKSSDIDFSINLVAKIQ
jgi:cytoskeletal protein RodZ